MKKYLADVHTHTYFSPDGQHTIEQMCAAALQNGLGFYGVSEHIDYDLQERGAPAYGKGVFTDEKEYFHTARHLQEDYAGAMNVFIGIETGYCDLEEAKKRYAQTIEKYRPDYVINSVHSCQGEDYCRGKPFYLKDGKTLRPKREVYEEYLGKIKRSICQTEYPYDIVGHIGYCARYAPYEDYSISVNEFGKEWEEILKEIIRRGKILEVNTSDKRGRFTFLPCEDVLKKYYELGGRKVSFGSDAHFVERIADKREEVVEMLKEIGFTHFTIPFRGEHIKVEL